jgi:hypothetical protein
MSTKYYKEMSIVDCTVPDKCTDCGVLIRLVAATESRGLIADELIPAQT